MVGRRGLDGKWMQWMKTMNRLIIKSLANCRERGNQTAQEMAVIEDFNGPSIHNTATAAICAQSGAD